MKQNGNSLSAFDQKFTVLFFFFRQEGYNAKAFLLCWQQGIWSFTHNKKFLSLII